MALHSIDRALLDALTLIASHAAAAIIAAGPPNLTRRDKADRSPVTAGDEASEAVILAGLAKLLPGVPVVSEEAAAHRAPDRPGDAFLLVDPLDGTRELLAGESEYTVNIALLDGGLPVAGVIAAPALGTVWTGLVGQGAERFKLAPGAELSSASERTAIRTRARPANAPVAVVSRFHREPATDSYLDRIPGVVRVTCGSSIKFCRVAEGNADIYPRLSSIAVADRLSSISEWDIAAGHAVLVAAGGTMTAPDGGPVRYGCPGFRVAGFLAVGDRSMLGV